MVGASRKIPFAEAAAVLRRHAGRSRLKEAAQELGVSIGTASRWAREADIQFPMGGPRKAEPPPPPRVKVEKKPTAPPRHDFASPELRREIEAAKREAPTAQPYKGRSWQW